MTVVAVEDELSPEFVEFVIDKCMDFMEVLVGYPLHSYQKPFARRIIESVVINDGEEISGLASRQSGKSELIANTVATLMVLMPRLAKLYPDLLGRFEAGIWIGLFAPVEGQVETLFNRVMSRLTSDRAKEVLADPEIDDSTSRPGGVVKTIRLVKSGSSVSMMTANPRAKIESRTFHLVVIDEAQGSSDNIVAKSIGPMLAYNAGCLTGDSRVLMSDGSLVRIDSLVAEGAKDAQVLAPKREDMVDATLVPRKIEAYHNNGPKPVLRLTLRGGRQITATHNHRFVKSHNLRSDRNKWGWTRADELTVGDRIAVPWQEVSTGKAVETVLPELLGWIISEGSITGDSRSVGDRRGQIEIAQTVPELVADISSLITEFDPDLCFVHSGRRGRVQRKVRGPHKNPLKDELVRLNLWGKGARDKRIPDECFGWDNDAISRLMSRLFAGDGCLHNGTTVPLIKYTTISQCLATDMQLLLDRLGIYATINSAPVIRPKTTQDRLGYFTGNTAYTLVIADVVSQKRFIDRIGWMKKSNDLPGFIDRLSRKSRFRTDLGLRYEKVVTIDDLGTQSTYDLQVADSHCYVVNGVVSHNTMVKSGTPTDIKNNFYKTIQRNKRRQVGQRAKQQHFEWDWKEVAKINPNYGKFVKKEMLRIGEDSDEFQMCVGPDTRVLTADLRHIPACEVVEGMELVGFDEDVPAPHKHRKFKTAVVEKVSLVTLPSYRICLSDGTTVIASEEHPWLVRTSGSRTEWRKTKDLAVKRYADRGALPRIIRATDVWDNEPYSFERGYLAAAFDGEGCLSKSIGAGLTSQFSQKENTMWHTVREFLEDAGFAISAHRRLGGTGGDVGSTTIQGGSAAVVEFLGRVRPQRLLDKFRPEMLGSLTRNGSSPREHPLVESVEFIGDAEVVAFRTSTRTFVAEGLASHNSYCVKWVLERGMFVNETVMNELSDTSMEIVKHWHKTPVVVGIDPARKLDSTVVTVLWVDWDRPDEFGFFEHRVLNWLELTGEDWEQQYAEIVDFLANYDVLSVGVDANGVGDAVAQRLALLLPRAEVIPLTSSQKEQSSRFKHLQSLIQRRMIGWPGNSRTKRLRTWKRFMQQMIDAERKYNGPNFTVAAPEEAWAHDDYVDSLALAASMTIEATMPSVEVSSSPFFS